jgi:hypothetical protein
MTSIVEAMYEIVLGFRNIFLVSARASRYTGGSMLRINTKVTVVSNMPRVTLLLFRANVKRCHQGAKAD